MNIQNVLGLGLAEEILQCHWPEYFTNTIVRQNVEKYIYRHANILDVMI